MGILTELSKSGARNERPPRKPDENTQNKGNKEVDIPVKNQLELGYEAIHDGTTGIGDSGEVPNAVRDNPDSVRQDDRNDDGGRAPLVAVSGEGLRKRPRRSSKEE